MKDANYDHHRGVIAWSIIIGILLPVVPLAFEAGLIADYGAKLGGAFIGTQITSMILSYTALLFSLIGACYVALKNINGANAFFWWSFYIFFASGIIATAGYGLWAPYNAIEAFVPTVFPLLAIAYLNKRSGKAPWIGQFVWAAIILAVLIIAWIVICSIWGWRGYMTKFESMDKGNPELLGMGGISSGPMFMYLIGLTVLSIGSAVAKRNKGGLGATEWIGLLLTILLPFIYTMVENGQNGMTDIITYFRCWSPYVSLGFIFIYPVMGYYTEPWDRDFVAPRGEEEKGDFGDIPDERD